VQLDKRRAEKSTGYERERTDFTALCLFSNLAKDLALHHHHHHHYHHPHPQTTHKAL